MGRKSERTLRILEYYKDWFKDNPNREPPNIKEVESLFKTSENYVYKILQFIADELGMDRMRLLNSPHYSYECSKVRVGKGSLQQIDLERLKSYFDAFSKEKAILQQGVNDVLAEIELNRDCPTDDVTMEGEK